MLFCVAADGRMIWSAHANLRPTPSGCLRAARQGHQKVIVGCDAYYDAPNAKLPQSRRDSPTDQQEVISSESPRHMTMTLELKPMSQKGKPEKTITSCVPSRLCGRQGSQLLYIQPVRWAACVQVQRQLRRLPRLQQPLPAQAQQQQLLSQLPSCLQVQLRDLCLAHLHRRSCSRQSRS